MTAELDNEELETLSDDRRKEVIEKLGQLDVDDSPEGFDVSDDDSLEEVAREGTRAERRAGKEPKNSSPRKLVFALCGVALLLIAGIIYAVFSSGIIDIGTATRKADEKSIPTFDSSLKEGESDSSIIGEDGTLLVDVDSGKATVLPEGITPDDWVGDYYQEILSHDYVAAQKRLPAKMRESLTVDQLQVQVQRDPITSVSTEGTPDADDKTTVTIKAELKHNSGETSVQIWTFVKTGSGWVAVSRVAPGSPH